MPGVRQIILCVAHGTVEDPKDLPAFVHEIRRGRPAPDGLIRELEERYRLVGGSPLLQQTCLQARALGEALSMEARVAMRLWQPRVREVVADLTSNDEVLLVPLAPYSVEVYAAAARRELGSLSAPPRLRCIAPWGTQGAFITAHAEAIRAAFGPNPRSTTRVIVTAHSLPLSVIAEGDTYAENFLKSVSLLQAELGLPLHPCYQSQGPDGGDWLGPTLEDALKQAKQDGVEGVLVSPIGFLTEHIETLYDLDIQGSQKAAEYGLAWVRVPALGAAPGLIEALSNGVRALLESPG